MDNLTHSIVGFIAGETIARSICPRAGLDASSRRAALIAAGMIGGNLPDVDLMCSVRSASGKLGYLLTHRGYTHTLIGVAVLATCLYLGILGWLTWRKKRLSRFDHASIALTALFATALHLGMDFLNSYGVHPFWPLNDRWYYGDTLFIVEPWYWIAAAPLITHQNTRTARILLAAVLAGALILGIVNARIPNFVAAAAMVIAATLLWIGVRASARSAAVAGAAMSVAITLIFAAAGRTAAHRAESAADRLFPGETRVDHVLTPTPMTPMCWDVLAASVRGDEYRVRHALLSLMPATIDAHACGAGSIAVRTTAARLAPARGSSPALDWLGDYTLSLDWLAAAVRSDCHAGQFMQFARTAFVAKDSQGWILGDLRFDRSPRLEFAELRLATDTSSLPCERAYPWIAPLGPLIQYQR